MRIHKSEHKDLPSYVWVPVDESWFQPCKTIGNFADIKKISTKYAKVSIDNSYFGSFNIVKKIEN